MSFDGFHETAPTSLCRDETSQRTIGNAQRHVNKAFAMLPLGLLGAWLAKNKYSVTS